MAVKMKKLAKELCPPILWKVASSFRAKLGQPWKMADASGQDLDVYWDEEMAKVLETWGDGNAWNEIQFLMANCSGKVLDIACGTGKVMEILNGVPDLEIHGCDISDLLISKALSRGLAKERLTVCDATVLPYGQNEFEYSYSIGSLEHFTEDGIEKAISEFARVTRKASFHMMPTSRSSIDEGWIKTYQSFHNCSTEWWVRHFKKSFGHIRVLESRWEDRISVGTWFLCSQ
jgi:ubiquinone/menaquinone biosynthesis C-methylase UbiE